MWSVDSQDWRITAGGQTEALELSNVTQWANTLSTLTQGGNSLMHDLNNVTVGAAIKALPILHPKVKLGPVGVCAGWGANASYLETVAAASSSAAVIPAAAPGASPNAAAASATPNAAVKKEAAVSSGATSNLIKSPAAIAVTAITAAMVAFAL
jgi:hypothetical protein